MCQLTLIDFQDRYLNNLWLYNSLMFNTREQHRDGYGFFYHKEEIFKSAMCPQKVENLAEVIATRNFTDDVVLSHVRQISVGKVPNEKDSHPFETDSLVLFHNGTLKWKDTKNQNKYPGIDSEQFAHALEDELKVNKSFPSALTRTYSQFYGKFAFLIYYKPEDTFYVIRGWTAKLHKAVFYRKVDDKKEYFGTVINTELISLEDCAKDFMKTLYLLLGMEVDCEIKEVQSEEIYKYENGELTKIAPIKENYEPYVYPAKLPAKVGVGATALEGVINTLSKNLLSLLDLDNICYAILGKGLAYCTLDEVIHLSENYIEARLSKWNTQEKRKIWSELKPYILLEEDYTENGLVYPYMINSSKKLKEVLNKLSPKEKLPNWG